MPLIHTFTGLKLEPAMNPDLARTVNIKLGVSLTLAAGTVLGRKTADNLWYAYNDAGNEGEEVARLILQYAVATNASGHHFYGAAPASEHGQYELSVPAYMCGDFYDADLTGLDANGLADLQGRIIFGDDLSDANAIVHIP
jgi:hypothetical protein